MKTLYITWREETTYIVPVAVPDDVSPAAVADVLWGGDSQRYTDAELLDAVAVAGRHPIEFVSDVTAPDVSADTPTPGREWDPVALPILTVPA